MGPYSSEAQCHGLYRNKESHEMAHSLGLYRNKESHEMAHSLGLYPKFNSCLRSHEIDLGPCALMELGPCFSNLSHTGPYSSKAHSLGLYPKLNSCLWSGMLVCRCSAVLCLLDDCRLFLVCWVLLHLPAEASFVRFLLLESVLNNVLNNEPQHPPPPPPQSLHYCGLWK